MGGSARSGVRRAAFALAAALVLLAGLTAWPVFIRGDAIPFASPAFETQWKSAEAAVPNFWGPALQPAMQEPYQEAPGGTRTVQYFDKARMEQTQPGGAVTNGLLTVELISGKRQIGDATFIALAPSSLPVVGDPDNSWPPYAALNASVFPQKVARTGEPVGRVYQPDGTLALDPARAAEPGAAFGSWQQDPGGIYAHNIPLAFWTYLTALPVPWQTTMGYPLTEAFWVNVRVAGVPRWVLVQPFERRVLSYTPTNPLAFQVEMGNIGAHYYRWRYAAPDATATGTASPTQGATGTASGTKTATATSTTRASGTPPSLAITNVQLGAVTDTTFALSFHTSVPATSEILYGTSSHSYAYQQEIASTATQDHAITLTDLTPGTKYYFAIRVTAGDTSVERKEDFFSTTGTASATSAPKATATATATRTASPTPAPTNTPTPTNTPVPPKNVRVSLSSVTVGAANDTQLASTVLRADGTTIALALTYDGPSGSAAATVNVTNWSHDAAHARLTGTANGGGIALVDKQATIVISATVTIPFADPTTPALVVSFTQKVTPGQYAAGATITSPPLSNAKAPGYNVVVALAVALA